MMTAEQMAVVFTPILVGGMVIEHFLLKRAGKQGYRQRQTVNNLGVALGSRAILTAFGLIPFLGYPWMVEHFGLFNWDPEAWSTWIVCFLGVDLAMYLRHRAGHRVAILWALHGVHHQSRDYNLSAGLRLSWFQDAMLFAIPLAVLGLPMEKLLPIFAFGNMYQFILHTELIDKMGIFEKFLLTPSGHRVHHGCNPLYLDTNYGNFLLIWDRLFGTWQPETEPVQYGVLSGLKTYDASENSIEPLRQLVAKARATDNWLDTFKVLVMPPGWVPGQGELEPVMVDDPEPQRRNVPSQRRRHGATILMCVVFVVAMTMTWYSPLIATSIKVAICVAIIFLIATAGVMLDAHPITPVPTNNAVDRSRAIAAAYLLTLAGPYAGGPLKRLGDAIQPPSSES